MAKFSKPVWVFAPLVRKTFQPQSAITAVLCDGFDVLEPEIELMCRSSILFSAAALIDEARDGHLVGNTWIVERHGDGKQSVAGDDVGKRGRRGEHTGAGQRHCEIGAIHGNLP